MLKKFDVTVDLAENGLIAVEKFKTSEYDIVFMDLHMPEMNGFEATIEIREFERANNREHRVKIFAMTASSVQDESAHCMEVGMDGYLGKPFRNSDIKELLEAL